MFGCETADKRFGASEPMDRAKRKIEAAFELMEKLSIDYFCFHDRDIAPEGDTLAESNRRLDQIADVFESLMKTTGKKCLWGTANCTFNPRYMHGAGTAPNADVFAFAVAQIKKAIEITVRFGGSGYVYWGGRAAPASTARRSPPVSRNTSGSRAWSPTCCSSPRPTRDGSCRRASG
jgi:xylose isomerase